jgi:DMSO/TMAO reductase YedYZ heme-binding membrane subunit
MNLKTQKWLLIGSWIFIGILIPIIDLTTPANPPLQFLVRLFALYGFFMLSMAAVMTPFLKQIVKVFGKPFLKIHHAFALFGLSFITLHPILLAIITKNLTVFIPSFASWETFWRLGGRPALIVIYIAFFAAIFRLKIKNYWRPIHGLMYLGLLFGIVHANMIGTNLIENWGVQIFYIALFVMVIMALILKRYQHIQLKKKRKEIKA